MNTSAEPEPTRSYAIASGPPIRQLFRDVISDRLPSPGPPQAVMLFGSEVDPCWDDGSFLGDFYNEILHQDTCQPATADGLALLVALAVDERIPAQHRFQAVGLLFSAATVAERHLTETWPATSEHADPDSEARARSAVQARVPDLLARWSAECPAVRLALAGLAVVFPTDRTLHVLTPTKPPRPRPADAPGVDLFLVLLQPAVRTIDGRRRLLLFLQVADYPTLAAYCRAVGMSPSTVTVQLQHLERDLREQLLIRGQHGHRMRLTDLGKEVLTAAQPYTAAFADPLGRRGPVGTERKPVEPDPQGQTCP
ncbi:helix-turn-helix domain-containing protein [Streptomyces sp. NPDC055815]